MHYAYNASYLAPDNKMRMLEAVGKLISFSPIIFVPDNQDKISYFFLIRTAVLVSTANHMRKNEDAIDPCICYNHLETSNAPEMKMFQHEIVIFQSVSQYLFVLFRSNNNT